jgi:5-hydroxyisourate hydrolase-like protein (transthyretin family)
MLKEDLSFMKEVKGIISLYTALIIGFCASNVLGASLRDPSVSPAEATSNSIYTFSVVWEETDENRPPDSLKLIINGSYEIEVDPSTGSGSPQSGTTYTVRLSAGLNLYTGNPCPDEDVQYCQYLVANDDGSPRTITYVWEAEFTPTPGEGEEPDTEYLNVSGQGPIVHDSFATPKYGGQVGDRDRLDGYTGPGSNVEWDPLNTIGPGGHYPDDPLNPDDGTGSTTYVFKCVYFNSDNLPPQPWGTHRSGVVMYLYQYMEDLGDYLFIPYDMEKEDPEDNDYTDGVVYVKKFEPSSSNYYRSLPPGKYGYFFACSDDVGLTQSWAESPPYWYGDSPVSGGNRVRLTLDPETGKPYDYVDRPTLVPGVFNSYPYPALGMDGLGNVVPLHPFVNMALWKYPFGDEPSGLKKYCGTIFPNRRGVSPDTSEDIAMVPQGSSVVFRVSYQNYNNTPPREILVWVDGKSYPLQPENPSDTDYTDGAHYVSQGIVLSPGQHSYYFTARDDLRSTRYPANTTFRGPYVNTRPTLSNAFVSPASGTKATRFRWKVTYTDPNNQRPYKARLVIVTSQIDPNTGRPVEIRVNMEKEDRADNNYVDGVVYYFDSANLREPLPTGQQKYYFEFADDWGRPTDWNDRIEGETVCYPASVPGTPPGAPFVGPYILPNNRPVLVEGSVNPSTGTSETNFTWQVTYRDADNDAPSYVTVYIGEKQPDGQVWWYENHEMQRVSGGITPNYATGVVYQYTGRLPGDPVNPRDYYYCFVASDGADIAIYNPSASYSAHTIWSDSSERERILYPLDSPTNKRFRTNHYPVVGWTADYPSLNPVSQAYMGPIVFDKNGNRLIEGLDYEIDLATGEITLKEISSSKLEVWYWFGVAGPTDVGGNNPPTLKSGSVSPNPGTSSDTYTFSVTYTDLDNHAPASIRVKLRRKGTTEIQDIAMTLTSGLYRNGAKFEAQIGLAPGVYEYYFEATDGYEGYALLDASGSYSEISIPPSVSKWFVGPYVNDPPILTNGKVEPTSDVSSADSVTYSVKYTDRNNEPPDSGYPSVYIDNPAEVDDQATVTTVGANILVDSTKSWSAGQFAGMPVYISSGSARGKIYFVLSNTGTTLTVNAVDLVADGVSVGDRFIVGRIPMVKDPADNIYADGMNYTVEVAGLPAGNHTYHFRSVTTEVIGTNNKTRRSVARYPSPSGELTGPSVTSSAPSNNVPPVLTNPLINGQPAETPVWGKSTDSFTFRVTYADANGHPPSVHNGVRGFVHLVIGDEVYEMRPVSSSPNYRTGAVMAVTPSLTGGTYRYHFEAFDGWSWVRLPANPASDYKLTVNRKPVLSDPSVTPSKGNSGQVFTYSVVYSDPDGNAPEFVKVYIDGSADSNARIMTKADVSDNNYKDGVRYICKVSGLSVGSHTYFFTASDGTESALSTSVLTGPIVYVNHSPTLTAGSVSPASGNDITEFTYTVTYKDEDGDAPKFVKVYIDGTGESNAHVMTKASGSGSDYASGVQYVLRTTLPVGSHTYFFVANDWLANARYPASGVLSGPTVSSRASAKVTVTVSKSSPFIGESVTISGTIVGKTGVPLVVNASEIKVNLTRAEGGSQELAVVSVTKQADGSYKYKCQTWTPTSSGTWTIQAIWAGNDKYEGSTSEKLSVVVGPTYSVSGLDMISIPLEPASGFPESLFGKTPPFALAKWIPEQGRYKLYSLLPGYGSDFDFPFITPGQSYWIKTLEPKTIAPVGTLVDQSSNFEIPLSTGWNQIGCPFVKEVAWSSLRIKYNGQTVSLATAHDNNWVREYGWTYDRSTGNYKLVDANRPGADRTMKPWAGYWVRALVDCTLIIPGFSNGIEPPPVPFSAGAPMSMPTSSPSVSKGWLVQVTAINGELKDSVYFGQDKVSERLESPGCLENFVDVYFTDELGSIYASDVRASVADGDVFLLQVVTDHPGDVTLTWDGVEDIPSGLQLVLVDDQNGKFVPMSVGGSYTFKATPDRPSQQFRIIVEGK